MHYKQFYKKLNEDTKTFLSFGKTVNYSKNRINIDGIPVDLEFQSVEEARKYCKTLHLSEKLEENIKQDTYDELNNDTVAYIISEHHKVKVTDTLIESYLELASSKIFTLDPVIYDIKKFNKLDRILEDKIDYKLSDGSIVVISEETQNILADYIKDDKEIIEYMRESKENFLKVLEQLEE